MLGDKLRCNERMGCSGVKQNCCKGGVDGEVTDNDIRCFLRLLGVDEIDLAPSKRLRRPLLLRRGLLSVTTSSRCSGPHVSAGVPLCWCFVLILLIRAAGGIVVGLSAIVASSVNAHYSACPTIIVLWLVHRALTSESQN